MKVVIAVLVLLSLAVTGVIGYVVVDSRATPSASGPAAGGASSALGALVETISRGERVALADYVAPGIRTVFLFTADW